MKLIKPFIFIAIIFFSVGAKAQVSLIQTTIDKLESYKNFSYKSIFKINDNTSDTLIIRYKDVFSKAAEDKKFGYFFSKETIDKTHNLDKIDVYNGQNIIHLFPHDSIYYVDKVYSEAISGSLLDRLMWIKRFLEKKPFKITKVNDTAINTITYSHLIVNTFDTTISKEHYYTRIHLFIDKISGLPYYIISKSRNTNPLDGITHYYSEQRYFDYKLNTDDVDIAPSITIPKGFHIAAPTIQTDLPLLTAGTVAPDWTLSDVNGEKTSLSKMKGKVILLDFFFVGCGPCIKSIEPLNNLHEKYKNQNVIIMSISSRDSSKKVMEFGERYNIKYSMYGNLVDVAKLYNVTAAPTFYFIGKDGKIANTTLGYSDDFETNSASIIDDLLKK